MSAIIVAAIAVGFSAFYVYRKFFCFNVFKKHGIPGPEPHWFFGNARELWRKDRHEVVRAWGAKYGKVFGCYEGTVPMLIVSDLASIDQIGRKDTSTFKGRSLAIVQPNTATDVDDPLLNLMISMDSPWRVVRSAASHFFRDNRLKKTTRTMEQKLDRLTEILNKHCDTGEAFNILEYLQMFALDTLSLTSFGINLALLDPQHPNHDFGMEIFRQARDMVRNGVVTSSWVFKLVQLFPILRPAAKYLVHLVMNVDLGPLAPLNMLLILLDSSIEQRRPISSPQNLQAMPSRPHDLLQLLCDATNFDGNSAGEVSKNLERSSMTVAQLKTNVATFGMAGYETTSTTLSVLVYLLALHADKQQKLFEEINQQTSFDYDNVMYNMKYLDAVCNECIRLFPEGINIINRSIAEQTSIGGYVVDKTMSSVLVDTWSVHNDVELWGPVPTDAFHPERFLPDYETYNRPESSFLGFGLGPKKCIGKSFALLELKMSIIKLLQRYVLLPPCEEAPKLLPVLVHLVMIPSSEVRVKLAFRS